MPVREILLPEFDHEMASTCKTLERVPEDKFDWKPHPKSGSMGWLAAHIADTPKWAPLIIEKTEFDVAPEGSHAAPPLPKSRAELLEQFERNVQAARSALNALEEDRLMDNWTLLASGKPIFTVPRIIALRNMVFNHLIHHRAQLALYLRLNDIPVPGLYGPSADEA